MFDRVVVVDWSASSTPKSGKDSIWVCVLATRAGVYELANPRTRTAARDLLLELLARPGRTLVGFDFPFGYPTGFADAIGVEGRTWAGTWTLLCGALTDDDRNLNNRWEVATALNRRIGVPQFWGAPPSAANEFLPATRPPEPLPRWRLAEERLRGRGRFPFSTWQLLGAGSVGSQALTGIPVVQHLRRHPVLRRRSAVWPFETGLALTGDGPDVIFAEVWPSAIPFAHIDHPVKDARQVVALARHLAALGPIEPSLTPDERRRVLGEEGWVLGVD